MESRQAHEGKRWWWPEYERRQSFRERDRGGYDPGNERYARERYPEATSPDRDVFGPYTGKGPRGYRRSDHNLGNYHSIVR